MSIPDRTLRQVELPGHPEPIADPTEAGAEPVVVERHVHLTALAQPVEEPLELGLVLALAFCFSLGDLGVIALFDTKDFVTLPLLMVRALGAYRTNDAGTIAALMLVITIIAFTVLPALFERLSRARA